MLEVRRIDNFIMLISDISLSEMRGIDRFVALVNGIALYLK
ncbi:hypothetical protein ES707_16525 [subsurface metagenome]